MVCQHFATAELRSYFCGNSLKVLDKYDRAVDNASVELRYNDPSDATAFTPLLMKKIAAVPMILIFP